MKPRSSSKSHDPDTFPVTFPPLPTALPLGKSEWTEFMQRRQRSSRRDAEEPNSASFFSERMVEAGKTELAKLYYKEVSPQLSPEKAVRAHRRVRPLSISSDAKPKPSSFSPGRDTVEEATDKVEIQLQALRSFHDFQAAMEIVDAGWMHVQRNIDFSKSAELTSLKRFVLAYRKVAESASSAFTQAQFSISSHKCPPKDSPKHKNEVETEAKVPSITEQIERQLEAKRKLEELEEYLNKDSDAYEELKKSILELLQKSSSGAEEYLEKLYREMLQEHSIPDTKISDIPEMELPDEVQRQTAQKVFDFCEKRHHGQDSTSQTETEFVDEMTYREVVKRANAAELRREEMREAMDGLNDQIALKTKLMTKMQTDFEAVAQVKDQLTSENASLAQQLTALQRDYNLDKNELETLRLTSKSLRKEVKSLSRALAEMRDEINTQKMAITQLEEVSEEQTTVAREAKSELRILYKQYFQPKALSKMSAAHMDTRRRSISIPRQDPVVEEVKRTVKARRRFGSADKGKRDITATLGLEPDCLTFPRPQQQPVATPAQTEANAEAVPGSPVPQEEESSAQPADDSSPHSLEREQSLRRDWSRQDPIDLALSKSPQLKAASRISLHQEDEIRESLASTYLVEKERKEGNASKMSLSSSATKKVERRLSREDETVGNDERRESRAEGLEGMERTESLQQSEGHRSVHYNGDSIEPQTRAEDQSVSAFSSHPSFALPQSVAQIPASLISFSVRETASCGVMTDPVMIFASTACSSVGVQFNSERPEMEYEEDGGFRGTDGVKYYMWPLNPNQLYGLSGDVFYHTVMRVFSAMPKVPLSRTGEVHQPQYHLSEVSGTQIPINLEVLPHHPRKPHDAKTCGKDCMHTKRPRPKRDEKLWPLAKQDIKY